MLKTLLRRSGSEDGLEALQLYVIAVCSDKMKYRLSNGPSPLYFDCLLRLCGKTFPFIEHPDILPTRRDGSHRDQFFLDAIPMLADFSMTKIPNLEKVAQLALEKKPFEVYNKDTYMEYHGLLCELLKCFRGSLTDLVGLKSQDVKQIRQALTDVRIFGDLLWTMVRGAAIEKHLQTVADFLDTPGVVKVNKGGVVGVNKEGVVGVDKEGVVGVDKEGTRKVLLELTRKELLESMRKVLLELTRKELLESTRKELLELTRKELLELAIRNLKSSSHSPYAAANPYNLGSLTETG